MFTTKYHVPKPSDKPVTFAPKGPNPGDIEAFKAYYTPEKVAELRFYFEFVQDRTDWKAPIAGYALKADREIVAEAIAFFTGSEARFTKVTANGKLWRVYADGYYAATGA